MKANTGKKKEMIERLYRQRELAEKETKSEKEVTKGVTYEETDTSQMKLS